MSKDFSNYQLAQLNIAKFERPADDPINKPFFDAIDSVNAVAESSDGFIWRLVDESDDPEDLQAFDDPEMLINLSVWRDIDALAAFVYRDKNHLAVMRRKSEWFVSMEAHMVLWWISAGHQPTLSEAKDRLELLKKNGTSNIAFTFKDRFDPPA